MHVKTNNIMQHIEAHSRAVIKLDRASGYTQVTITKRSGGRYVIGTIPGARLVNATEAEVVALLENNRIYLNSWS